MSNPSRVIFTVFGRDIYWYGVLIAIAIIIGVWLATKEANRKGFNPEHILDFAILAIPLAVIFARLYYVIFEWSSFQNDLIRILYIWEGGLAIYGAIIGGIIAAIIFCKWKKIKFLRLADIVTPSVLIGQAIGRWGNFFNQEAFGPVVKDAAWKWFPFAVKIDATNTIHMATFFYESFWCFLVFIFLMLRRKKFKHNGDVFVWYVMLYSFERMFVEGLRQDSLWMFDSIRVSQLLSAVLFVAALGFILIRYLKEKKSGVIYDPITEEGPFYTEEMLAAMKAEKSKNKKKTESSKEEKSEKIPEDAEEVTEEEPKDKEEAPKAEESKAEDIIEEKIDQKADAEEVKEDKSEDK